MKKILKIHLLLYSIILMTSCIRDHLPPCPNMTIRLEVKDKNYFNVNKTEFEESVSSNLPLGQYVPTIYYRVVDPVSGNVLEEKGVYAVEGEEKEHVISLCDCLGYGTYAITVWGGLELDDRPENNFPLETSEHSGIDLYMAHDTVTFSHSDAMHSMQMERTKGKLIVVSENLPDDIVCSEWVVDGISEYVDNSFRYHGRTSQKRHNLWDKVSQRHIDKHILSPGSDAFETTISMNYYDTEPILGQTKPAYTPQIVKITPRRNELTVLKYVYEGNNDFSVFILINDNWEQVYGMEID